MERQRRSMVVPSAVAQLDGAESGVERANLVIKIPHPLPATLKLIKEMTMVTCFRDHRRV